MTYHLSNWGPANAGASTSGVYWSNDNVFNSSDLSHLLATDAVPSLNANQGSTRSVSFSTSGLAARTYYIFVVADYTNSISEINDSNNPSSGVALAVTAAAAPEIAVSWGANNIADGDISPSSSKGTDFGSVAQGGAPVQRTFTVVNSGNATLSLGSVNLPTGFSLVEGLSPSIAPGGSDTFTIQLNTTNIGSFTNDISFSNNDSDENPYNFRITGTVTPPASPEIAVSWGANNIADGDISPSSSKGTDFGSVAQGVAPVQRTFTVVNSGNATLSLGSVNLPAGFSLVEGLSPSIAPGGSDTFTIQLNTTNIGSFTNDISFSNNDSDENPYNFRITGTVTSAVIGTGQIITVFSGQVETSATILAGGYELVSSGGTASGTTVNGGSEVVYAGGTASGTVVGSGGVEYIASGGMARGATVNNGGQQNVAAGGSATGSMVSNGGVQLDAGNTSGTQVSGGGGVYVEFGGLAVGMQVSNGGTVIVHSGGVASGTTLTSGGVQDGTSGGYASGTVITTGGKEYVEAGGAASGASIATSAYQVVYGSASGTTLNGIEVLSATGRASTATVLAGGVEYVASGTSASSTVVNGGGQQNIASGGAASGTTVNSGGVLLDAGRASAAVLNSAAGAYVMTGGVATAWKVNNGGAVIVQGGGVASNTTLGSGGVMDIAAGGVTSGTAIQTGGKEYVEAGGSASGTTVATSAYQVVYGSAFGVVLSGGIEVLSGIGRASSAIVSSGGVQYLAAGTTATNTVVSSGGQQNIAAGGSATGTVVSPGGTVLDAGAAIGMIIFGGGVYVLSGGTTTDTTLRAGADIVQGGGKTSGTIVNGGAEIVSAAGTTISAHVNSGGLELVSSGGTASAATISGGTLEVMSGGLIGSNPVTFAVSGGGILKLDDSIHFSGLVAGFAQPDMLYVKDIAFVSGSTNATWTQSGTSGTLAVTNGTQTADVTLLGQYSTLNFHVSSSSQGGTIITDPPLASQTDPAPLTVPHLV